MNPPVPFAWRAGHVRAAGATLATYESGSRASDAPVALLLHGLGYWSEAAWSRIVPLLDPRLHYVALDLPGFGASEKPAARYDAAYFRGALGDVVASLGRERVALVGHSLGGFIAADYAGFHPDRVSHLGLIAPAGFSRQARHVVFALAAAVAPWVFSRRPPRRLVRYTLERSVADRSALDPAIEDRAYQLLQDAALRRALAGIYGNAFGALARRSVLHAGFARYHGPVLCAWGARDRFTPPRGLRDVVRVYPHAQTLVLSKSAHQPMIEEPVTLGAAVRAFLSS
jgi:pimeloyl-ACP methyl ester carboxylesterase